MTESSECLEDSETNRTREALEGWVLLPGGGAAGTEAGRELGLGGSRGPHISTTGELKLQFWTLDFPRMQDGSNRQRPGLGDQRLPLSPTSPPHSVHKEWRSPRKAVDRSGLGTAGHPARLTHALDVQ